MVPKLLVVEDAEEIAVRLVAALRESFACDVTWVANAIDAIERFGELAPDVTIVDFSMPGEESGLELIRAIRAQDRKCPILVFSFHGDASIKQACLAAGADRYLRKSDGLDPLLDALAEHWPRRGP